MRDEKFYSVHSDSGLYAAYFDYVNCREKAVEALKKFEEENGFKDGSLAVWGTTIYLKSASEDFLRYRDQLTKQSPDPGVSDPGADAADPWACDALVSQLRPERV